METDDMEGTPLVDKLLEDLESAYSRVGELEQFRTFTARAIKPHTGDVTVLSKQFEIPLKLGGIAITEGTFNGLTYSLEELERACPSLIGCPITVDHPIDSADAKMRVRDEIGKVTEAQIDSEVKAVRWKGFVVDEDIARRVYHNLVDSVSIGAAYMDMEARKKGVAKGFKFIELSIVKNPACKGAKIALLEKLCNGFLDDEKVTDDAETLGVTPGNPAGYGKSTSPWSAPMLGSFTSKSWDDLTTVERRKIASHFTWSKASPPEKFGDLKLPHHNPTSHAVVWRGVAAAMAALAGARGGVNIPSADKSAVRSHLASHYREFEKTPPSLEQVLSEDYGVFYLDLMEDGTETEPIPHCNTSAPSKNLKNLKEEISMSEKNQETEKKEEEKKEVEAKSGKEDIKLADLAKKIEALEAAIQKLLNISKQQETEPEKKEEEPEKPAPTPTPDPTPAPTPEPAKPEEVKKLEVELGIMKARVEKLENLPERVSTETTEEKKDPKVTNEDICAWLSKKG